MLHKLCQVKIYNSQLVRFATTRNRSNIVESICRTMAAESNFFVYRNNKMAKADTNDLLVFLKPFDAPIAGLALWLREFIWELYPECNELIYDNYNAVAVGWSPTLTIGDIFCSVAVYNNKNVHLGFYWGSRLSDPKGLLLGKGKQYRYIRIAKKDDLPVGYAKELLNEAHVNSLAGAKNIETAPKCTTVVKSISPRKNRPTSKTT